MICPHCGIERPYLLMTPLLIVKGGLVYERVYKGNEGQPQGICLHCIASEAEYIRKQP